MMMRSNRNFKILMIPLMVLLLISSSFSFMVFFGFKELSDLRTEMPLSKMGLILIQIIITVFIYYHWVKKLNKILPWKKIWIARFAADAGTVVLMVFCVLNVIKLLEQAGYFSTGVDHFKDEGIFIMPLMIHTLYITLIELSLSYEEKNDLEFQLSHIEKLHLHSQYQALKQQLDHHFLFNNLSVLSSIIYEDVEKADAFIQRLSSVYRYVLSINKNDLVTVEEELEFIRSYLQLYKFRFEGGFNYTIDVDASCLKEQIPPLTLQVLVENSIKHNVVSLSKPLNICIYNKESKLIVENNIQIRESAVQSTHTGLQNLKDKYKLLGTEAPCSNISDTHYRVTINLIPKDND